mmetsp:Transcript_28296/g.45501  ORF Transcript_28296/g.45501 Transcript_28296/m.45501 type:complete len:97 (-) Transcript_28296:17-307(-)
MLGGGGTKTLTGDKLTHTGEEHTHTHGGIREICSEIKVLCAYFRCQERDRDGDAKSDTERDKSGRQRQRQREMRASLIHFPREPLSPPPRFKFLSK